MTPGLDILAIALGGALGSLLRYGITSVMGRVIFPGFPWGVFIANMIGCFLIGLLSGYFVPNEHIPMYVKLGILVGFLGGLTTFSTFSLDNFHLLGMSEYIDFVMNIGLSVFLGLLLTTMGMYIAMKWVQ